MNQNFMLHRPQDHNCRSESHYLYKKLDEDFLLLITKLTQYKVFLLNLDPFVCAFY